MLIFNTTYKVSSSISNNWIQWVQKYHIPFMLTNNIFTNPQIAKIIGSEDEEGISYSVQFKIADLQTLMSWHKTNAETFQHSFSKEFGNEVQFFSTVLEIVE